MAAPDQAEVRKYPVLEGDYTCYDQAMRDAILNGAPVPVSAQSACDVMQLIDAGLRSAGSGRIVELPHAESRDRAAQRAAQQSYCANRAV